MAARIIGATSVNAVPREWTWQHVPSYRVRIDPDVARAIDHLDLLSQGSEWEANPQPGPRDRPTSSDDRLLVVRRCLNHGYCRRYWEPCHRSGARGLVEYRLHSVQTRSFGLSGQTARVHVVPHRSARGRAGPRQLHPVLGTI